MPTTFCHLECHVHLQLQQTMESILHGILLAYADESAVENIAMKAAMTMPVLLLQRPHHRSGSTDHVSCLKDRLECWKDEIDSLLHEYCSIQSRLVHTSRVIDKERSTAGSYARLLGVGNVKAVLRQITEKNSESLPLDSLQPHGWTVKEHLLEKHPPRQQAHERPYRIAGKFGGFKIWRNCQKMHLAVFKLGGLPHRVKTQSLA